MHLNDPLRSAAEGLKKDYVPKLQKHQEAHDKYYPTRRDGEPDEWDAM